MIDARPLVAALILIFSACNSDDCIVACERPFELSRQAAKVRFSAWTKFPPLIKVDSDKVRADWEGVVASAQSEFQETCLPDCRWAGPGVIACRKSATSLKEWNECE